MTTTILALLEEHDNSTQVKNCLEQDGYRVFVVDSFVEAKAILKLRDIDLIISDVHLDNGGNVFDFLRWVNRSKLPVGIPFVLFSFQPSPIAKYLADGVRTSARVLGAAKYIEMDSFDAKVFSKHIENLLPRERLDAERDENTD